MSKFRVQMESDGIPAYQEDFETQGVALFAAKHLVDGANGAVVVEHPTDLIRYQTDSGYVRAFALA